MDKTAEFPEIKHMCDSGTLVNIVDAFWSLLRFLSSPFSIYVTLPVYLYPLFDSVIMLPILCDLLSVGLAFS